RDQWGDAALKDAIPEAFQIFTADPSRLVELHLHDNNGTRDEHLWPTQATAGKGIDWGIVRTALNQLSHPITNTLEIAYDPTPTDRDISRHLATTRKLLNNEPL
ncbi:MAG: hypothetical protein INR62_12330, partial [Rhodospirillales bacterium]|nr:hypothetical protein [Acetobacter sp.]